MSSPDRAIDARQPWSVTLAGYLTLARVSNSPTVVSNVLAGAALSGVTWLDARIALLAGALALFYTAGMVLNDLCDYEWDRRQRPDRPLPAGIVSRRAAGIATIVLFAAGCALLWLVSLAALASGVVLIALIGLYDRWHKGNPLGPLVMAGCRLLVYVTAFVAFAWPLSQALLLAGGLLVLYMVGLTAIAKSEIRPNVINYWPAALLFLPAVYFASVALIPLRAPDMLPLSLALLLAGWAAYSATFVYRRVGRDISAAVAGLIAGISLLDSVVMASAGARESLAIALAAFGLTLFLQCYVEGT